MTTNKRPERRETCEWTLRVAGLFEGSCGMFGANPKHTDWMFCPRCGGRIVTKENKP